MKNSPSYGARHKANHAALIKFLIICMLFAGGSSAVAQTTAFSYQGRLIESGIPANGSYDFIFRLYGTEAQGTPMGPAATNSAMPVSAGLFNAYLDFGSSFPGAERWLEISVRTNGTGQYTTLTPRQHVTSAPYAITAGNLNGALSSANLSGVYTNPIAFVNPSNQLTGSFSGNGARLTGINGAYVTNIPNQYRLDTLREVQLTATAFKVPPKGWSSWNGCGTGCAAEPNCIVAADSIATNGLLQFGYNLIHIDAGWQGYRDTNGFIHENTNANHFPHGMSNLVWTLHQRGFKVGLWHTIGLQNIAPPGNNGFFASENDSLLINTNFSIEQELVNDATTFVNWGIDYVKLEGGTNTTTTPPEVERRLYELFASTCQQLGKPMYIMAAVGQEAAPWMRGVINARRCGCGDIGTGPPIEDRFSLFMTDINTMSPHPEFSGPGCFISLDVIPASLTDPFEPGGQATFMLMNSMLNSEIVWTGFFWGYGKFSSTAAYMTNLLEIDNDPAALMARCFLTNETVTVWKKPLGGADSTTFALAFLNTATSGPPVTTTLPLSAVSFSRQLTCLDLYSNYVTVVSNSLTVTVPKMTAYGCKMTPFFPSMEFKPGVTNYLSDLAYAQGTTNSAYATLPATSGGFSFGRDQSDYGAPLTIRSNNVLLHYAKGIGGNAEPSSQINFDLHQRAGMFHADVGHDKVACPGAPIIFQIWGDGTKLYDTGTVPDNNVRTIDCNVAGVSILSLIAMTPNPCGNDIITWGNAYVTAAIAGQFTGDGSGLTGINAANLTGALASSALFGTYTNAVSLVNPANHFNGVFSGVFNGSGAGLTNLSMTGKFANDGITYSGQFAGSGSLLTDIPESAVSGLGSDLAAKVPVEGGFASNLTVKDITSTGDIRVAKTIVSRGVTGDQTVNTVAGRVNIAANGQSIIIKDSYARPTSVIIATVMSDDATATSCQAIPGDGSFTLKLNDHASAETSVSFIILN